MSDQKQTPDQIRESIRQARLEGRLIEEEMRLSRLKSARSLRRLRESSDQWDYLNTYQDILDRMRQPDGGLLTPISIASDRKWGANWPFWRTWTDHAKLRGFSRIMLGMSTNAQGGLEGLTSFVVSDGCSYRVAERKGKDVPDGLASACQELLEEIIELNDFAALEQELFMRDHRDGESFTRHFVRDDGMTDLRVVEPEFVIEDAGVMKETGETDPAAYSFGVYTDPDDVAEELGAIVSYTGTAGNAELVPADEIDHLKIGVDSTIKRGMPDFVLDTYDLLKTATRALENMGEQTAIQSAITMIRQHETALQGQAQSFSDGLADYQRPNPFNGNQENVQRITKGTVFDIPKGMTFAGTPFSQGVPYFIQVVQLILRNLAVKWNAPEWLFSGDASNNNYASSLTAESPFVRRCKRFQGTHTAARRRTLWRCVQTYVETRKGLKFGQQTIPWEQLRRLLHIQAEAPSLVVRDELQEAQKNQIYFMMGEKSLQTIAQQQGDDYEQEQVNRQQHAEQFGGPGLPLDVPPEEEERAPAPGGAGGASGNADSGLRATVGGLNAIAALQADYYAGKLPRVAAIANVQLLFGFKSGEAERLFPEVAPTKLTPDDAPKPDQEAA